MNQSDGSMYIGEVSTKSSFVYFPSSTRDTITRNIPESKRHRSSGELLITIGSIVLGLAVITAILPNTGWTVILAVGAIFLGNAAFNHFERAAELNPPHPTEIIHGTQLFDTTLHDGRNLQIVLEIYYQSEQDSPFALDRIKLQLQRTISSYLPNFKSLPTAPYVEMDMLLQTDMEFLRKELNVTSLVVRTIEMKVPLSPQKAAKNIRI